MTDLKSVSLPHYSEREEKINSVSHPVGIGFGLKRNQVVRFFLHMRKPTGDKILLLPEIQTEVTELFFNKSY